VTAPDRYLGLDFGAARVGLATGDAGAKLARPHSTVAPGQLAAAIEAAGPFKAIIVGLPRGLDGQDTAQTLAVRRFSDELLEHRAEPVIFQDEAATSAVAKAELEASGKPYTKEQIDAQAAAIILQDYLDSL